jgi:hypothetical protein
VLTHADVCGAQREFARTNGWKQARGTAFSRRSTRSGGRVFLVNQKKEKRTEHSATLYARRYARYSSFFFSYALRHKLRPRTNSTQKKKTKMLMWALLAIDVGD